MPFSKNPPIRGPDGTRMCSPVDSAFGAAATRVVAGAGASVCGPSGACPAAIEANPKLSIAPHENAKTCLKTITNSLHRPMPTNPHRMPALLRVYAKLTPQPLAYTLNPVKGNRAATGEKNGKTGSYLRHAAFAGGGFGRSEGSHGRAQERPHRSSGHASHRRLQGRNRRHVPPVHRRVLRNVS